MQYKNIAYCSSGVCFPELLPYGQSCLFCSVGRGFFRRKLSRLGPWRPRGSSGGMNLNNKEKKTQIGCCDVIVSLIPPPGYNWPSGTTLDSFQEAKTLPTSQINTTNCLLVVHKGVHEKPLLDAFLPLGSFPLEVSVGVVGYDHSIRLWRQLDNETVVVANHPFTTNAAWGSEHHDFLFFKQHQDVLVWNYKQIRVRWPWWDGDCRWGTYITVFSVFIPFYVVFKSSRHNVSTEIRN